MEGNIPGYISILVVSDEHNVKLNCSPIPNLDQGILSLLDKTNYAFLNLQITTKTISLNPFMLSL